MAVGRGADDEHVQLGFTVLAQRACAEDFTAAELCHEVARLLERLGDYDHAETFHRRAGLLLVNVPTGHDVDRQRIKWARSLAANLAEQERTREAIDVLRAAIALSEGLLGVDDVETTETALALDELIGPRDS